MLFNRLFAVMIALVLAFTILGFGRDIYVDDNAPDDPGPGDMHVSDPNEDGSTDHPYDAIQEGVNDANSGDTVIVKDGTYEGADYAGQGNRNIVWYDKHITVKSENGPTNCIIDCNYVSNAFYLNQSGQTSADVIDGFKIINGLKDDSGTYGYKGGGILCVETSPTIKNCVIQSCEASSGSGIYLEGSYANIYNCTIKDCNGGSGIHIYGLSPSITRCCIRDNQSGGCGAGIRADSTTDLQIEGCTIIYNYSDYCCSGGGGGLYLAGNENIQLRNTIIAKNAAYAYGGGICVIGSTFGPIQNCTFAYNEAGGSGGAIFTNGFGYDIEEIVNCIFYGNEAWEADDISVGEGFPDISYTLIQYISGEGNIYAYPYFKSPSNGDFHLQRYSPCIDAGDPNRSYEGQSDFEGDDRVIGPNVDIGADEFVGCFPQDKEEEYYEWTSVGRPVCWCHDDPYYRQCHGDADGASEGKKKYWVSTNDLAILTEAWNKPYADINDVTYNGVPLICADFDHASEGKKKYRVSTNDLDILVANWQIPDGPEPNCP